MAPFFEVTYMEQLYASQKVQPRLAEVVAKVQ